MARQGSLPYLLGSDFHRLAYVEFGNPAAPAVLCVHGLTRSGRDFDALAEYLAAQFHVICPDLPGRGKSDWLPDSALYQPASYVVALAHLLAAINKPVAWVGTSLGGICGIMVASAAHAPVTRLVLNDVGPHIPAASLARIRDYLGNGPETFATMRELEAHLRQIHGAFGPLSDQQWAHLARFSARPVLHGGFALHYDPKIAEPIRSSVSLDVELGPIWDRINVPVLAIRGAQSDLLLPETLERMANDGAETLIVPDTGHAPALMDIATMSVIRDFLLP
ncbi:MAG: 2-hydroxy-6-oxo-6-phenylhexa-2,4-dienoate hydrolase [Rhodospirillales bacterium 20-60-12]|nr:MAG: 2-hydroxy-6-oxo-6-phenylhexa-2,4-dienoate hydrolase [Rhodospirillales bacterium 20-60-12]HQT67427.1 alpha/beta fold hydrolase [Acetobacteraceae bacterium]